MNDITIIMTTFNKVPAEWAKFHKETLLNEIGSNTPIITISKDPLDWGTNILQTEYGMVNLYKQMLKGAKLATTPYIAMVDDDTLYPAEHFKFRPPLNKFAYNHNRWHLFTWGQPYYFYKPRPGNGLLIASRDLVINGLTERFNNIETLGDNVAGELGTKKRTIIFDKGEMLEFYTIEPVVSFYHQGSVDGFCQRKTKRPWPVRAYDLPKWGHAKDLREKFK